MSLHQSLKIKLIFPILLILTIIFITSSYLIIERERNTARDALIMNAHSFASLSADKIIDNYELYYNSGFLKYRDIIDNILSLNQDITNIQIIDYYGKIHFDSNEIVNGKYEETLYGERVVDNNTIGKIRQLTLTENRNFNNSNNLEIILPYIDKWGQHQHSLRYLFSYSYLNILETKIIYDIIILSIFFLIISLGLIFLLFYQFITLPIKKILKGINITKKGSFDHKIDINSRDEIGKIASSFNEMIVELKKSKDRIEKYSKNLEKTIDQKNQLITQLSHDLKTPLGPINNLISMLIKDEDDKDKKERLEIIRRNAEYMKNLVVNIIYLVKYNSPELKIKFYKLNVTPVIHNILFYKKHLIQYKNIKIINNLSKDIYLLSTKVLFEQIFTNIFENAIKYNKQDGTIEINARSRDEYIEFSVRDTGIGLTKNQIDKIFDEFYKVDESRHDIKSSGLGMTIVKRLIELHKGKIRIESNGINKGTTVYFSFPSAS